MPGPQCPAVHRGRQTATPHFLHGSPVRQHGQNLATATTAAASNFPTFGAAARLDMRQPFSATWPGYGSCRMAANRTCVLPLHHRLIDQPYRIVHRRIERDDDVDQRASVPQIDGRIRNVVQAGRRGHQTRSRNVRICCLPRTISKSGVPANAYRAIDLHSGCAMALQTRRTRSCTGRFTCRIARPSLPSTACSQGHYSID